MQNANFDLKKESQLCKGASEAAFSTFANEFDFRLAVTRSQNLYVGKNFEKNVKNTLRSAAADLYDTRTWGEQLMAAFAGELHRSWHEVEELNKALRSHSCAGFAASNALKTLSENKRFGALLKNFEDERDSATGLAEAAS